MDRLITHGVNLSGNTLDYNNRYLMFGDLIPQSGGFNWYRGIAPTPAYDENGWPTVVDSTTGTTTLTMALGASLTPGDWTIKADSGAGKISLQGLFEGAQSGWKTVEFNGDGLPRTIKYTGNGVPWAGQVPLRVDQSNKDNPIKGLSIVLPGHVGKKFHDSFLKDLEPFDTLRMMDVQYTNGSKLVEFKDRNALKCFSCYLRGRIDEETLIELCNLTHKDLWICIPALANDDYIKQLAALVDNLLDKTLTVYVEYSNEVWNDTMPQWNQHKELYNAAKPKVGMWEYIAFRDGHATNLFKKSLPTIRKCVRVLARQLGYYETLNNAIVQYKANGHTFDAISTAVYFYPDKLDLNATTILYNTDKETALNNIFTALDKTIIEVLSYAAWYKKQADINKVPLIYYEGGQHIGNWKNDASTEMIMAANRDPRMGERYDNLINGLPKNTGPFCWYNDAGSWNKWGSWGLKEKTGQSESVAHKYRVVANAARKVPVPTPEPEPKPLPELTLTLLKTPTSISILTYLASNGVKGYLELESENVYKATLKTADTYGYELKRLYYQEANTSAIKGSQSLVGVFKTLGPLGYVKLEKDGTYTGFIKHDKSPWYKVIKLTEQSQNK